MVGSDIPANRFRANFVFGGSSAFEEDTWLGKSLVAERQDEWV